MSALRPCDRIIVPLDVPTFTAAAELVERLPQVGFWKVGLELFVSSGPQILELLRQRQKRIFLDLKFHDIPNTMAGACRVAARYGVDLLTVHALAGRDGMLAAQEATAAAAAAAGMAPPQVLAVTVLTSLSARALALDLKVPLELSDYVLQLALLAQDCGLGGIVCSAKEAPQLRRCLAAHQLLVCPGIRPTTQARDDQTRTVTPQQALRSGASYLVIGRPITAAPNPAAAFEHICQELAT